MQQSAKFIHKQLLQNKPQRKTNCYSTKLFSTFHLTFIKILNVDKNNKRVYKKKLINVANVYYTYAIHSSNRPTRRSVLGLSSRTTLSLINRKKIIYKYAKKGGSVAEWLACRNQAQKGLGSNRSRVAVG